MEQVTGVTNLGKAINIEYGNIEKKGNIESMLSKFESKFENWSLTLSSMLLSSMFPFSMLFASITNLTDLSK